ncbi:MAG: hypothetical protein NWE80_03435 [Candidatus Bathyarchaeota archaeon]|nr:hypothetical protein [Candidatus Bathyarchaeota archaeon]
MLKENERSKEFFKSQEERFAQVFESSKLDRQISRELSQEIGRLQENVEYGRAFWAFGNSDSYLASLESQFIARVVDSVAYWTSVNMNSKISATPEIALKTGLTEYYCYDPTALLNFLAETIRNHKVS